MSKYFIFFLILALVVVGVIWVYKQRNNSQLTLETAKNRVLLFTGPDGKDRLELAGFPYFDRDKLYFLSDNIKYLVDIPQKSQLICRNDTSVLPARIDLTKYLGTKSFYEKGVNDGSKILSLLFSQRKKISFTQILGQRKTQDSLQIVAELVVQLMFWIHIPDQME